MTDRTPGSPARGFDGDGAGSGEGERMRRVAVVAAGLSTPSSTRLLADRLAERVTDALAEHGLQPRVETIELRDLAHPIADHLLTGFAPPALAEAIRTVTEADGLIVVTPTFSASFSGLFKSFVDVLDPASLTGMPVLIAATGGSERHSLVLDFALRPLFTYLKAVVVPTGVFAASADWGADSGLPARIGRAAGELAELVGRAPRTPVEADPFAAYLSTLE